MSRQHTPLKRISHISILAAVLLLTSSIVLAQSGDSFSLPWFTVAGGGAASGIGGEYTLGGTIGQTESSNKATGGNFTRVGGFWGVAAAPAPVVDTTLDHFVWLPRPRAEGDP